ncbi:MJ1255/VC2487 family glycosyltransferase [Simiduia litorea]|uniref:MJ1255/VC2487 family glycosyltransferase n=1 Tax=Simiduia litorea TaxID=1435348 RepID=UPI0036F3F783
MKRLLFGVQATGNGHITRANVLVPKLRKIGFEVDVLLSGRERQKLFGLETFGHYRTRRGFSFVLDDGRVNALRTLCQSDVGRFIRDIKDLDVHNYDLVLTDFEPVTAWAAKTQGKKSIGIGHQYAFNYPVPKQPLYYGSKTIMKNFAPADVEIGLHWDAFGAPILPPIIASGLNYCAPRWKSYLVYLPFDDVPRVTEFLRRYPDYHFIYYASVSDQLEQENITIKPYSRTHFSQDLMSVEGVVCGAGFELPSEVLSLGKKLLVQPLAGQFEQLCNAQALTLLASAHVMHRFDDRVMKRFLRAPAPASIKYPDVAQALVEWLADGAREPISGLSKRLWTSAENNPNSVASRLGNAWAL